VDHAFCTGDDFSVGIEEELLLVEGPDNRLSHSSSSVLAEMGLDEREARHDVYEAQLELSSPPYANASDAARHLAGLRVAVREAGGTAVGSGLHPAAQLGDVQIVAAERYRREAGNLRGIVWRTPDCALHVHVGMPDPESAVRACNGLCEHVPVLEALAANSPFWHGADSGLASARRTLRRGYPRVAIPPAFRDYDHYHEVVAGVLKAAEQEEYTFIWWEVRPHPRFGTVEVRAMDSQSSLPTVAGIGALVQGLAAHYAERPARRPALCEERRAGLEESSFRAARDGLAATLYDGRGAVRPVTELAREAIETARPHLGALGSEAALEEVERLLREGGGADRRRAAHRSGGMDAVLSDLVAETRELGQP
jgi:glutamate---cysteine ligase / carboxylate-amine ligase